MDHPLENLGPERFQMVCQALLVAEFPNVVCYPVGQPDGGRDAQQQIFDGPEGQFAVFQVKFSRSPSTGEDAREWVLTAARGEVEKVKRLQERGAKRYFFATNVQGTAHLDSGSIDRLQQELETLLGLPVVCWWRDDINRRLDGNWDIKLRYPEILSGQDFLRLLLSTSQGDHQERRLSALRAFLGGQYQEDQEVKFKQVELQNQLLDLFVDLPFRLQHPSVSEKGYPDIPTALQEIVAGVHEGGFLIFESPADEEQDLLTATLLLSNPADDWLTQIVVEGAPGQGKSTLAQYLCQVHRIRLLSKEQDLRILPEAHRLSAVLIPFKVDLRDFSEWLAGSDPFGTSPSSMAENADRTLETFLTRLVQNKGGGVEFSVNDLHAIAKLAPFLVVLDGLDEVADIKRRSEVVGAVTKAIPRMRENSKRMRVIVTSRPAAFANSPGFDSKQFSRLELGSVNRSQISQYANKWMDARGLSVAERKEFQDILGEKLDQPHLRDLSRNPMQLTILLSLIHTRGPALPDKRTTLYDAYVDLFFSRESTKNPVVRRHLDLLKDIHRYLAWKLHSSAESTRGSTAAGRLTSDELRQALSEYLKKELQDVSVVDEIFNAMLERVVMIVSRIEGTHEFEVQPLREYFAARYLYDTASYSPSGSERTGTKPDRFDAIARNFYWLNVTRFFCGCFSKGELLDLADRIKDLVFDTQIGTTRHPVSLSAMLLCDWVFTQSQKAMGQVAALISSRDAIRRLMPRQGYPHATEIFRIPRTCGGSDLCDSALSFLFDMSTRFDVAVRLGMLICANSSSEERIQRWVASFPHFSGNITRWIWVGQQLDCIAETSTDTIQRVLGTHELSDYAILALLRAGHLTYVSKAAGANSKVAEVALNSVDSDSLAALVDAPLFLIPALLQLLNNAAYYPNPQVRRLIGESIANFSSQSLPTSQNVDDLVSRCYGASLNIAERLKNDSISYESIEFWEEAIANCVRVIGDYPALVIAAINFVAVPRSKRGRPKKCRLLFAESPLCDRLRCTKANAGKWEWWSAQLQDVSSENDRFLWMLSLWAWAPFDLLVDRSEDIKSFVEELAPLEWSKIVSFAGALRFPRNSARSSRKRVRVPDGGQTSRVAYLLAVKGPEANAKEIFLSHFLQSAEHSSSVCQFRQYQAFSCAIEGRLPWHAALGIIRETYKYGSSVYLQSRAKLPEAVADSVMASPDDYPTALWDLAEGQAAVRARRRIRPVAKVAAKENWFID